MSNSQQTLFEIANHIINQHPILAPQIELLTLAIQGKGYGTSTIEQETKMVHQLLNRDPKVAIDIGGNIGEYTAELRRLNQNMEIHVFEPSSTNVKLLNERFMDDRHVVVVPYAVSDNAGSATLYSNEAGSGLGSLTHRRLEHFNIDFSVKETVSTIRFEDYWRNNLGSRDLDIVKLDIEGHELAALRGFGKAVHSIGVIQFEFGGCNIDTRTYFQDFWYFFKERNFDIYRITPLGVDHIKTYRESDECFSTTNYIAVNTKP